MSVTFRIEVTNGLDATTAPPAGSRFRLVQGTSLIYELRDASGALLTDVGVLPASLFFNVGVATVQAAYLPVFAHDGGAAVTLFQTRTQVQGSPFSPVRSVDPSGGGGVTGPLAFLTRDDSLILNSDANGAQVVHVSFVPMAASQAVDVAGQAFAPTPGTVPAPGQLLVVPLKITSNLAAGPPPNFLRWPGPPARLELATLVTNNDVTVGDLEVDLDIDGTAITPAQLKIAAGALAGAGVDLTLNSDNSLTAGQTIGAIVSGGNATAGTSNLVLRGVVL